MREKEAIGAVVAGIEKMSDEELVDFIKSQNGLRAKIFEVCSKRVNLMSGVLYVEGAHVLQRMCYPSQRSTGRSF